MTVQHLPRHAQHMARPPHRTTRNRPEQIWLSNCSCRGPCRAPPRRSVELSLWQLPSCSWFWPCWSRSSPTAA